jgi:methyl-accepting chemotaxis protein
MQHDASLRATAPVNGLPVDESLDLRQLLHALQDVSNGDFSARLPGDWTGLGGKIADTFNEIVNSNRRMAEELERIGEVVGKRGKTRSACRADGGSARGARWRTRSTR